MDSEQMQNTISDQIKQQQRKYYTKGNSKNLVC